MRNYWAPSLGQSPFSIFKASEPREVDRVPESAEPVGDSIFSILRPTEQGPKGNMFFSKADLPSSEGGDPFAAAAPQRRTVRGRPGGPTGEGWKPYPRMREGYRMPASLSGPGTGMSFLQNPAFWLIAGTGVLIALEVAGITNLSKKI